MEIKDLIEKITREVIEKMESGKETSLSSPLQALPPEISKRITPVVQTEAKNFPASSVSEKLLVLVENSTDINKISEWLKQTPAALSLAGSYRVKENLAHLAHQHEFLPIERFDELNQLDTLPLTTVYPLTSIVDLSKLAHLICDTPLSRFMLSRLEKGEPTVVLKLYHTRMADKERELLGMLKEMGVEIKEQFASDLAEKAGCSASSQAVCGCHASEGGECGACGLCAALIPNKVNAIIDAGANRLSAGLGTKTTQNNLAQMIDHTLLKPDATKDQVLNLCREAREHSFFSVCINPAFVKPAAEALKGSQVKVCTVVGFPLGATTTTTKVMETRDAIANGADEIDMVINVGALKAGNYELVRKDIEGVIEAAEGRIVKVILETALLTDEEKIKACELSKDAGADFVKTSTGFGPGGATAHDIALMRKTVGKYMGVKASGGIRDFETARQMIEAGATRIGASASVAIVKA